MSLGNFMELLNNELFAREEQEDIDATNLINNGFEFNYCTDGCSESLKLGSLVLLDTCVDDPTLENLRENLQLLREAYRTAEEVISKVINSVDEKTRQREYGLYTKKEWDEV